MTASGPRLADSGPPAPENGVLGPVSEGTRLRHVDALRGFAILGVVIGNVVWMGYETLPAARAAALPTAEIDRIVLHVVKLLVEWKFYTLFSFLFGLGFALQLTRAASRGARILPTYARRLGILFVIGALHACLLWSGDVLNVYAALGFVMIAFRHLETRTLLVVGLLLAVAAPAVVTTRQDLRRARAPEAAAAADLEEDAKREARLLELTRGPHPWRSLVAENVPRATGFWRSRFARQFLPSIFGKFLLGFYVGRLRILEDLSKHRGWLRRLLWGGLLVGAPATLLWVGTRVLVDLGGLSPASTWTAWANVPRHVGIVGLAGFYAAALLLLLERPGWSERLAWLAAVGRLALTNYLGHSLVMAFLFYGFGLGLLGRVGAAFCLALSLALYAALAALSAAWLRAFRFGPVEWLWRSLTYGKVQPMMRRTGGGER